MIIEFIKDNGNIIGASLLSIFAIEILALFYSKKIKSAWKKLRQ